MLNIHVSELGGVRMLHFGSDWVQGSMRIARPWSLELEYTRDLMLPLLFHDERWPRSVLQVGLGAASITRFLHRYRPEARLTVAEIAPEVVAAARHFFKLPDDPERLRIEIAEGYEFMQSRRGRFDFIVVDAYDEKGRPGMLETASFYHHCRERLTAGGMLAANLLTRRRSAAPSLARLRDAFGEAVLALPCGEAGNLVAIAAKRLPELDFAELREAALRLKAQSGLDLRALIARLERTRGR